MKQDCIIYYRDGGFHLTQIDDAHTPLSLGQRMTGGGFVVCEDERWGKKRTLVVNLADVKCIDICDECQENPDELRTEE